MILQNILFPSTDTCTEETMYFRKGENVSYNYSDDGIAIKKETIFFLTHTSMAFLSKNGSNIRM